MEQEGREGAARLHSVGFCQKAAASSRMREKRKWKRKKEGNFRKRMRMKERKKGEREREGEIYKKEAVLLRWKEKKNNLGIRRTPSP